MLGGKQAWHEDELPSFGTSDDELISPLLDLTNYSTVSATFKTTLNWSDYLANYPNTNGDGENDLYVRINGGAWTEAWTDTRVANTTDVITVDLTALIAGQANVEFAFRFFGSYAQEWWVDYVQLDGISTGVSLAKAGTCPGPITLSVINASANGSVVVLYGASGSYTQNNPVRPCLGLTVGINIPNVGGILTANGSGSVVLNFNATPAACGLTVQAVDLSSCTTSNTITL